MTDLRPIDQKRLDGLQTIMENDPMGCETWYVHSVLAQCFLPYRDQKDQIFWNKKNGNCSIDVSAGRIETPTGEMKTLGLPYGAKPRLFLSYIQTCAVKQKSPIIPVETSMTGMLKTLGYTVTGGKKGTLSSFKEQTARLAASRLRIFAPKQEINPETGKVVRNGKTVVNADFFESFDVWFSNDPNQKTLWPSELVLDSRFYDNLREHAIPYDYRGLAQIQNNARAIDIFLWMTQRLQRIPANKPLFLGWNHLYDMFGGGIAAQRNFPTHFRKSLLAARTAYPEARINDRGTKGFEFRSSPPPIQKTKIGYGG